MLGADPPRRPPGSDRNAIPLSRSKSYNGPPSQPPRRHGNGNKRTREVLEDITWIINDPSSWQHLSSSSPVASPAAGPSRNRERDLLQLNREEEQVLDNNEDDDYFEQSSISGPSNHTTATTSINMARAHSASGSSEILSHDLAVDRSINSSSIPNPSNLNIIPRIRSSQITNLDSSSPPSSPRLGSLNHFSGVGLGIGMGTARPTASIGLTRAATLPPSFSAGSGLMVYPYTTAGSSSSSSFASSTITSSRNTSSATTSPSLRAPPPLRRSSSNTSLSSSLEGSASFSISRPRTPDAINVDAATTTPSTRILARAATQPVFTYRVDPILIPTIQREMPSPERKRTRRGDSDVDDDGDGDEQEDDSEVEE